MRLPPTVKSSPVFFSAQSYGGNAEFLNGMQFTVFLQSMLFKDPRDGEVYPVVLLDNKLWMARNLRFDETGNAFPPNGLEANVAEFGRLYPGSSLSVRQPPVDWRLPTAEDWQSLFATFGGDQAAYAALIAGGDSGFEARLAGERNNLGAFDEFGAFGFLRTSTRSGSGAIFAGFSSSTKSTNVVVSLPDDHALSIRYVKDL
jgi:uncharacterized protein (TIGR02145 family)